MANRNKSTSFSVFASEWTTGLAAFKVIRRVELTHHYDLSKIRMRVIISNGS